MKKTMTGLAALALTLALGATGAQAQKKFTIALVPGLTTDAFYITMRKGAEAAAKAVGADLVFQGAPDFNPVTQTPVLDAVIARKPDAILIAPTDKTQLVQPLKKAADAGHPGHHRRYVHRHRQLPDRRPATPTSRWPMSRPTMSSAARWRPVRLAKAIGDKGKVYVSNVKPGVSTTDQREEGFKDEMKAHPGIHGAPDAVQRRRRQQGRLAAAVRLRSQPGSGRRVRGQPVLGARRRQRREAGRNVGQGQGRRLRCPDLDRGRHQVRPRRRGRSPSTRRRSAITA